MFLRQQKHLLIQQLPVTGLFTYRYDTDKKAGGGCEVRGLELLDTNIL